MEIIDENGKKREILSIKKINHKVPDVTQKDKFIIEKFVEVVIRGKRLTWKEWYSLKEFKKRNPNIVVK